MTAKPTLTINGREVPIEGERNLLEVIRKANIEIPTFCYHSELSVYGACRLCIVDIEGRGIQTSCSTAPQAGMVVRTHTHELREMRRITIELLLANHHQNCFTCAKNTACKLQELAKRLGVDDIRFKKAERNEPIDDSSPSLIRDPNKCVLCGDCVRMCAEVQDIGAIDFAYRGSKACVMPAFEKGLGAVECVNCGQCASVCPTGALLPASEMDEVWKALDDPTKTVVAQVAPAVRVGLGEAFGQADGSITTGQIVAGLKAMGFDKVFDTSFTADLTVIEEATEFLNRKMAGEKLPQFTSCCPGWVKFAEQYYPDLLTNLSSCKSPQQMFGSLARKLLPEMLGVKNEDLVIVSIMPCTAKKFEAKRPEFYKDELADVDHVMTTQELAQMIQHVGIRFDKLEPASLDMPLGFKTGAGVIFGNSGGVSEAVLRYAVEKLSGTMLDSVEFQEVRGEGGLREATFHVNGVEVKLAVVHSLKNARAVCEQIRRGECKYDLIEVMACPGGCIGGAGQPIPRDGQTNRQRTKALYEVDKMLQLHKSQENHFVQELYKNHLGEPNSEAAHHLLHTDYQSRRRMEDVELCLGHCPEAKLGVSVCVGTSCYVKGSQKLLNELTRHIEQQGLDSVINVSATFCTESCDQGPTVRIGDQTIHQCTLEKALQVLKDETANLNV